jgi:hypothetical protein
MRWFQRDSRIYIGPVTELQMDVLRTRPVLASSGIACQAAHGKVEVYLTLPQDSVSSKVLEDLRMEAF